MKKTLLSLFIVFNCLVGNAVHAQTTIYMENFSSRALPSGWTNDSLGLPAADLWVFNNPFFRSISGATMDTSFALFDSDMGSSNDNINEMTSLTTSDISLATVTGAPYLELDEQYRALLGPNTTGSVRRIEWSSDAGVSWNTIVYDSLDYGYPNPAVHSQHALNLGAAANVRFRFTWTGTWDWWWAIDNVALVDYPVLCTAPPNAGAALSSETSVCPATLFSLTLSGADSATGITYQWQVSTDNLNWTNISGAISSNYGVSNQMMMSYYRCNLTCSGQTSSSVTVMVNQNTALNCYCIPPYTVGCDILDKVAINTLLNNLTGCNGNPDNYILYPDTGNLTTSLGTGDNYDITIASGVGSGNHGAAVWFDFNADGDFQDAGEFFNISDNIPELSGDITANLYIPNTALLGPTRMRVRYIYNNPAIVSSDCSSYGYGETEDYTVNIVLGTGVKNNPLQAISIRPIPAHDRLFIQSPVSGSLNITILDQTGRVCKNVYSPTNSLEINTGDLAAGVYFVRFDSNKNTITKKIIIN